MGWNVVSGKLDVNRISQQRRNQAKQKNLVQEKKKQYIANVAKFFKFKEEYIKLEKNKMCQKCGKAQLESFVIDYQTFDKDTGLNKIERECKDCDIWSDNTVKPDAT